MEDEVNNKKTKMEDEAILLLEVGLSTSRSGSCPTQNRPDQIGSSKFQPVADRSVDRIGWVEASIEFGQIGQGWLFGKRQESSEEKKKNGRNPTKFFWKMVEIRPDLARSSKILAIFGKILARSSEISPDLA